MHANKLRVKGHDMQAQMNLMPLVWALQVLTVLMLIDCAINKRDLQWFMILIFLGPLGGVVYLVYHWQYVTFPFRVANLASGGGASAVKRCPRCFKPASRLQDFVDARQTMRLCDNCVAELEQARR
jgi:hypothetical protein